MSSIRAAWRQAESSSSPTIQIIAVLLNRYIVKLHLSSAYSSFEVLLTPLTSRKAYSSGGSDQGNKLAKVSRS
jgi:hypothetical protein